MIKLINNEFNKIKKSKIFFIFLIFIIVIIIMNRLSKKDLFDLSYNLIQFIGVVVSILFSSTICGEIESGNARFYLTKPHKRIKIYFSKLLTIMIYTLMNIIVVIITTMIVKNNYDLLFLVNFFKCSIPLLFIDIYILFLSTKFKSPVLVASISIITLSFSLILSQILFGFNIKLIEYTFMPYLDFSIFNDKNLILNLNNEFGTNLNMNKGIIIDLVYSILLVIIGSFKFNKKDIKN